MDLKIKDVADLLNVSETTIRRWLGDGKIPAYRIHGQYRFSKLEIEDWVMSQKLGASKEEPHLHQEDDSAERHPVQGMQQFSLFRAIHKGKVLVDMPQRNKEALIRATMDAMADEMGFDPDLLSDLFIDREKLHSTALNSGIALPHTRDFLLNAHYDVVTVVFPKDPIPYEALDGLPVHTLFFLFACEDKRHLHLLAKIAHLSSQPEALEFLKMKPNKDTLLNYVKVWESQTQKEGI